VYDWEKEISMTQVHRRVFLAAAPLTLASAGAIAGVRPSVLLRDSGEPAREPVFFRQQPSMVKEFVGDCHFKIDRVEEMLKEDAGLAKVAWDWGFGDLESGIGAASHTGQVGIIELLLAHGARPDVFTMATLDKVDAVRSFIESVPDAKNIEGPHGISMFNHASAGKASRVMEYLESQGITAESGNPSLDESDAKPYVGSYASREHPKMHYVIEWSERWSNLNIQAPNEIRRGLMLNADGEAGKHAFHPAGSRGAVFQFAGTDQFHLSYAGQSVTAYRI
jgi:hypothetical protein